MANEGMATEKEMNISGVFEEHFDEKNIAIIETHSITEEAFENLGDESIHENVSPISNLNEVQGEGPNSIDQNENYPINDCEETEKENETDTFYCNSCGADDWFDRMCSNSEYEYAIHLKLKPFKCSTCETAFSRKHYLRKHLQNIHEKPEDI